MDRTELFNYLEGAISPADLQEKIWKELKTFEYGLLETGRSAEIIYNGDNESILFTAKHLKRLCTDYVNGSVNHIFLSYCADALLLSEHTIYAREPLQEHLEQLTDFEINGLLTDDSVRGILRTL